MRVGGLCLLKICRRGQQVCSDHHHHPTPPPKNVTFFHLKLLLDNSASFTSARIKELRQNWKIKLIFRGAYRLSGIGIVECLEIVDVGCNLKQFDGLIWLTLTPHILRQIYAKNGGQFVRDSRCQWPWSNSSACCLSLHSLRIRSLPCYYRGFDWQAVFIRWHACMTGDAMTGVAPAKPINRADDQWAKRADRIGSCTTRAPKQPRSLENYEISPTNVCSIHFATTGYEWPFKALACGGKV